MVTSSGRLIGQTRFEVRRAGARKRPGTGLLHCRAMHTIDVFELQRRLSLGGITLLDVRTDEEVFVAALPGAKHIPMQQLPMRLAELNPGAPVAVLCHHGVRSELAARFLEQNGFADVSNVAGGIDAWSMNVDPTVPRY